MCARLYLVTKCSITTNRVYVAKYLDDRVDSNNEIDRFK